MLKMLLIVRVCKAPGDTRLAALPSLGNAKGKLLPRNSVAGYELPKIPTPADSLFRALQQNKANPELTAVF